MAHKRGVARDKAELSLVIVSCARDVSAAIGTVNVGRCAGAQWGAWPKAYRCAVDVRECAAQNIPIRAKSS